MHSVQVIFASRLTRLMGVGVWLSENETIELCPSFLKFEVNNDERSVPDRTSKS